MELRRRVDLWDTTEDLSTRTTMDWSQPVSTCRSEELELELDSGDDGHDRTRAGTSVDTSYTSRKLIHGELESEVWLRLHEATGDRTHMHVQVLQSCETLERVELIAASRANTRASVGSYLPKPLAYFVLSS
ncbi:hypothetical protein F2Q70_00041918 [Brassica cretica]|uniref:Uncharacterized protein n=1 Tax=Brassica cretica TaxID=69181 RepID=A0A8S9KCN4_BRACR|nr:hypothetical protein F2Q70_00041918 [Brassica cretica]KAF2618384.1 hypothetical protein F2Q68_00042582 [Brassica cretica]